MGLCIDYIRHVQDLRPANSDTLPVLPPEIVHHMIIWFLWDDPLALFNCALTCHAWRPASQRNLLHSITLHSHSQLESFVHQVLQNPQRRPYLHLVRNLLVTQTREYRSPSGPLSDAIVHHFLGRLTHLQAIEFHDIDWAADLPPGSSFFRTLSGFTSVTRLTLHGCVCSSMQQLISIVSALSQLAELSIGMITAHADFSDDVVIPERFRKLQLRLLEFSVALACMDAMRSWIVRTPSARSITHLIIHLQHIPHDDLFALRELLLTLGESLLHLEVTCADPFEDVINLAHNTNLQFLRLQYANYPIIVDWARYARIVSQVTSRLRGLEIWHGQYQSCEMESTERRSGMEALDVSLSLDNFDDLERVEIVFVLLDAKESETIRDLMLHETQHCLTHFHARGLLSVNLDFVESHVW